MALARLGAIVVQVIDRAHTHTVNRALSTANLEPSRPPHLRALHGPDMKGL